MTIEERFELIERLTAGMAEERRKDREEYKELWRDTQRKLDELSTKCSNSVRSPVRPIGASDSVSGNLPRNPALPTGASVNVSTPSANALTHLSPVWAHSSGGSRVKQIHSDLRAPVQPMLMRGPIHYNYRAGSRVAAQHQPFEAIKPAGCFHHHQFLHPYGVEYEGDRVPAIR